jgi:uncharacterized protein RhaS with RHS repeats
LRTAQLSDRNRPDWLVNRYYDPSTDQFLSVDPDLAETGQPYAFTGDNPLNATDPLGLFAKGLTADDEEETGNIYILVSPKGTPFYNGKTVRGLDTRVQEHANGKGSASRPSSEDDVIDVGEFPKGDLPVLEQYVQNQLGFKVGHPGNAIRAISGKRMSVDEVNEAAEQILGEYTDPETGINLPLSRINDAKALQFEAYENGDPIARAQMQYADELNGGLPPEELSDGSASAPALAGETGGSFEWG